MIALQLHRYQFALLAEPLSIPEFNSIPWGDYWLSYSKALPVQVVIDRDGIQWCLLGRAIDVSAAESPEQRIRRSHTSDVAKARYDWAGRWVLMSATMLFTDAAATLGVYYHAAGVSSSPALLPSEFRASMRLVRTEAVDWYPPPVSSRADVRRLLPSQCLVLSRPLSVLPVPLLDAEQKQDTSAVLDDLATYVRNVVGQCWGNRNLLALTAGSDSRVLLAAAVAAGAEFETYTQVHPTTISRADLRIPPLLAKLADTTHHLIPRSWSKRRRPAHAKCYDIQCDFQVNEQDREFLRYGQFDFIRPGDLLIRGLGGGQFRSRNDPSALVRALTSRNQGSRSSDPRARGLHEWLSWVEQHPSSVGISDRFHWEQRLAGWMAASELALDVIPVERFNPFISHRYFGLVRKLPNEVRWTGAHHRELIKRLAPQFLEFPINPPESRWTPRRLFAAAHRRLQRRLRSRVLYD
jgi:hypothetical protein